MACIARRGGLVLDRLVLSDSSVRKHGDAGGRQLRKQHVYGSAREAAASKNAHTGPATASSGRAGGRAGRRASLRSSGRAARRTLHQLHELVAALVSAQARDEGDGNVQMSKAARDVARRAAGVARPALDVLLRPALLVGKHVCAGARLPGTEELVDGLPIKGTVCSEIGLVARQAR